MKAEQLIIPQIEQVQPLDDEALLEKIIVGNNVLDEMDLNLNDPDLTSEGRAEIQESYALIFKEVEALMATATERGILEPSVNEFEEAA